MYKLIDTAKNCGFDAVKFQLFKINNYFLMKYSKIQKIIKKGKMRPRYNIPKLKNYCKKKNFICITPFYLKQSMKVKILDFYKIASYELNWLNLIEECSKTRKYLILSTGMAKLKEVKNAVKIPQSLNPFFSFTLCLNLSTKENLCNLKYRIFKKN